MKEDTKIEEVNGEEVIEAEGASMGISGAAINDAASGKASEELKTNHKYVVQDILVKLILNGLKPRGDGLPGVPVIRFVGLTFIVEDEEDIKNCVKDRVLERIDCTACDGERFQALPNQVLDYIFYNFQELQIHNRTQLVTPRGEIRIHSLLSVRVADSIYWDVKLNNGGYIKPEEVFDKKKMDNVCLYGMPYPRNSNKRKYQGPRRETQGRRSQFNNPLPPIPGNQNYQR